MENDDDINRAHIWPDLVPVWIDTAATQQQIAPIHIGNQSEHELLKGMLNEVRRLTIEGNKFEKEWSGQIARKCTALIELFLAQSKTPITDADPLNLAILFYEYGRLTMPSSLRDLALSNTARHHVATVKKHKSGSGEGGHKGSITKKSAAAERKAKAKKIWDSLSAPERNRASIVASRIGVTPKTIREWRKAGWE
ncbi:hypothetical protein [Halomonas sp. AOP42-E1-30]|uniref:hypothetical protein n=1 Tax=Halomonas sp. AOP42-E1-30 TaxID=3457665 RepID=UPI004034606E